MERNKKKILLLISGLGPGGAERIFHTLAVELSKNHQVIECVYNLKDQVYPFATKENYILTPKVATNLFQKLLFLILRIYRLWRLKRKLKPDVCISQLESSDYLNILTRQKRERAICLIQCSMAFNHDIGGISGWWRKKVLMPLTYRKADAIVAVSSAIKVEFQQYFDVAADRIHIIYNFINLDEVRLKSKESLEPAIEDILSRYYCFVTAGRLTAQKNQIALISVFSKLKERSGLDLKLIVLGDGELRQQLINEATGKGLKVYSVWEGKEISSANDIFFLGFDKNPFKYFAHAKWFVFSSLWEGLPLVLVEAMASGVPIISADCPTGPSDILAGISTSLRFVDTPVDAEFGVLMPMVQEPGKEAIINSWCDKIVALYHNDGVWESYREVQKERLAEFSTQYAMTQWNKLLESL